MNLIYFAVFLPLFAALISGLFATKNSSKLLQIFNTVCVIGSSISACMIFKNVIFDKNIYNIVIANFLDVYGLKSNFTIKIDALSAIMLVLVTFVSACVHFYSISYMQEDKNVNRFFSYLSLFTFFMLILIVSDDFIQLFMGWEGVGLSSYLLISFWYGKNSASTAANKAFIVNRIGDFGLILAIAFCYFIFHTVNFTEIQIIFPQYLAHKINILGYDFNAINFIAGLIFIGCMGKSAQFGLHVWLPDAMEGPTPVSALIHAATMVTAGIFLVARCFYFFDASSIKYFILIISSITMIFAALIAVFQTDIKRIIAYSTMSQLGYMFVACAAGGYNAGMFHLVTHGFFKALLFLSAGSIIHAIHSQELEGLPNKLYKKLPYTFVLMVIATLAITGIPPFSGYYSKDAIIELLYNADLGFFSKFAYISSIITVFLTAFYSWKLIFKIFFAKKTTEDGVTGHMPHESGMIILIPMFLLSILSLFAGSILVKYFGILDISNIFWGEALTSIIKENEHLPFFIHHLPLILSISGLAVAYYFSMIRTGESILKTHAHSLYRAISNKFYIDELYNLVFINSILFLAKIFYKFDANFIDKKIVDGARDLCYNSSNELRYYHSGLLYKYNLWQFACVTLLVVYFVLINK